MTSIEGRVRESADGLRRRDRKSELQRLREARKEVAQAAADRRADSKDRGSETGPTTHG